MGGALLPGRPRFSIRGEGADIVLLPVMNSLNPKSGSSGGLSRNFELNSILARGSECDFEECDFEECDFEECDFEEFRDRKEARSADDPLLEVNVRCAMDPLASVSRRTRARSPGPSTVGELGTSDRIEGLLAGTDGEEPFCAERSVFESTRRIRRRKAGF